MIRRTFFGKIHFNFRNDYLGLRVNLWNSN